MWRTCFKFWSVQMIFRKLWANEGFLMACLQIYPELLSLTTFLRVQSNSKEVSYLSWQNTCPTSKTTCHAKLKFFLWTKLLENLLLAKYLISVTMPLKILNFYLHCSCETLLNNQVRRIQKWSKILCWINQEILKISKNNRNSLKAFQLMCP